MGFEITQPLSKDKEYSIKLSYTYEMCKCVNNVFKILSLKYE